MASMDGWEEDDLAALLPSVFASSGEIEFDYPFALLECPGDLKCQVIVLTQLELKWLVCVPHKAWHKTASKRKLGPQALSRPALVEISTARFGDRETEEAEVKIKVWIGFLLDSLVPKLVMQEAGESPDADVAFCSDDLSDLAPSAGSLMRVTNDHFSFLSAESGGAAREKDQVAASGSQLTSRVEQMEMALASLASNVDVLVERMGGSVVPPAVAAGTTSSTTSRRPSALKKPKKGSLEPTAPRVQFPGLDPSVVAAASASGVSDKALESMHKLITSSAAGAKKYVEPTPKKVARVNILSESEEEEGELEAEEGDGSQEPPLPPLELAVTQLAEIMGALTADRLKKKGSKVEAALDAVASGGSSEGLAIGSGKKAAAARRALRLALHEAPEEISTLIEKLMMEDLLSRTIGPGMPLTELCSRAWVEHRSKIGAYKVAAHAAWGISGVLDDLIRGRTASARARSALLLLQLDQCAVDKGSWTLAAELSLEAGPPLSTLAQHSGPSIAEGEAPYSKLLDPRWAEISLAHLKEQESYLSTRRSLGKKFIEETDPPKPKVKAKGKSKPSSGEGGNDS